MARSTQNPNMITYDRRLLSGKSLTVVKCGRAMPTLRLGDLASRAREGSTNPHHRIVTCGLDDQMVRIVTAPPVMPEQLETLLRRLFPTSLVPASPPSQKSVTAITGHYWRECQHRSPLRHQRLGLPIWRLCCSGCFQVYRLRIRGRDWAPFVGTGLQWCVSHVESRSTEWAGVPN